MSWAIWITGPPASGKSVIARAAADILRAGGVPVEVLELDEMRKLVTPEPTYSDVERDAVYRALVAAARALTGAGVPVIIDATGHRRAWRDLARATLARFAEVQLQCPLPVCREREARRTEGHAPRGIYARAGQPGAAVPGIDVPYEPAEAPDLEIDTMRESVPAAAERVATLARTLHEDVRGPRARQTGWALWVTGPPGSGKTTIAYGAAERLAACAITVALLDVADVRDLVFGGGHVAPAQEDLLHRALVYIAKRLTDAGVAVIVDATAPRRAWRELARRIIPRFGEVQLLCPRETCATRERAVRWHLAGCPHAQARRDARPDIVLGYEPALAAELTLYTDLEDEWTAADRAVALALRLHAAADGAISERR